MWVKVEGGRRWWASLTVSEIGSAREEGGRYDGWRLEEIAVEKVTL